MADDSNVITPVSFSSNVYRTTEAAVGGDLAEWLRERRANGCSVRRIADLLSAKGVFVTGSTVCRWCASLGIEKGQPS